MDQYFVTETSTGVVFQTGAYTAIKAREQVALKVLGSRGLCQEFTASKIVVLPEGTVARCPFFEGESE